MALKYEIHLKSNRNLKFRSNLAGFSNPADEIGESRTPRLLFIHYLMALLL